jgi:hypothetical protein
LALANKIQSGSDHQAVRIHCHSIRKRLVDSDAISIKAVIDGIVEAGVLKNDTAKEIQPPTFSQEKGTEEKTIITITSPLNTEPS